MKYTAFYDSPIGELLLVGEERGLTGIRFVRQKESYPSGEQGEEAPILAQTRRWLDIYFSGKEPNFTPPLLFLGTEFRKAVWKILTEIPYGRTISYGEIADRMAKEGGCRMSAQAVGGAVGHNEIPIIVPCHRVIGKDGGLTGYSGGMDKKIILLALENINL